MNWKTWIPLVLAVAFGLLAAKVGRDVLMRQRGSISAPKPLMVVVARQDLEAGHALTEADLALAPATGGSLPRGAFASGGDAMGRVLMATMVKGQTVLESLLAPAGTGSGAQALIPQGMRAVKVEVDETRGLGGLVTPGCFVDVVSTLVDPDGQAMARTIIQNVKVMQVGHGSAGKKDGESGPLKSVTLVVTPREAESVELATSTGKARLVLRSALDAATDTPQGVTVAELLGGPRAGMTQEAPRQPTTLPVVEAPAAKKPNRKVIEVITSGKVELVEIELPEAAPTAISGGGLEEEIPGRKGP